MNQEIFPLNQTHNYTRNRDGQNVRSNGSFKLLTATEIEKITKVIFLRKYQFKEKWFWIVNWS